MASHSSTLAWRIPWTEEPGGLQTMRLLRVVMTEWLHFHFSLSCIGEGNGNPLQCPCLENPRDGGAWWAAVCAVAQSRTQLKRLSSSNTHLGEGSVTIIKWVNTYGAQPSIWPIVGAQWKQAVIIIIFIYRWGKFSKICSVKNLIIHQHRDFPGV